MACRIKRQKSKHDVSERGPTELVTRIKSFDASGSFTQPVALAMHTRCMLANPADSGHYYVTSSRTITMALVCCQWRPDDAALHLARLTQKGGKRVSFQSDLALSTNGFYLLATLNSDTPFPFPLQQPDPNTQSSPHASRVS